MNQQIKHTVRGKNVDFEIMGDGLSSNSGVLVMNLNIF